MHDGDELCSKPGLHVMGDVCNGRSNGVPGGEWRVHDNTKAFNLEVDLVQGLKGVFIIKVVVERYSEVWIHDGGDKHGVFGRRWE